MRKTILLYGLLLAVLVAILKVLEYQYLVRDLSLEFYMGLLALFFTSFGVWAGLKLTAKKKLVIADTKDVHLPNEEKLLSLGISKREMEVLELIAAGFPNQEIADRLFVSLNTVKTHSSNLFMKLNVKRRTQAIQRAKELKIIS